MQSRAQFFKLKVEDMSDSCMRSLDLAISIGEDGFIQTQPYFKDPGLSRRLSVLSAHAFSTHTAWPRMMLQRAEKLSSSSSAQLYRDELVARLRRDNSLFRRGLMLRVVVWCFGFPYHFTLGGIA